MFRLLSLKGSVKTIKATNMGVYTGDNFLKYKNGKIQQGKCSNLE